MYYFNNGSYQHARLYTNSDGEIELEVPGGVWVRVGFYKSSKDRFLAFRIDGVPHIYTFERFQVEESGIDSETISLPRAHLLEARAIFARTPGGVENAIPRVGSVNGGSYFASGYSYTTTDEQGYMKLIGADFTGVEMVGDTRIWMYSPNYMPYQEQDDHEYAPYTKVKVRNLNVTGDVSVEIDISRRKSKNK